MSRLLAASVLVMFAPLLIAIPDPANPDPNSPRPIEAVDSVFIDRTKPSAKIDGGDWAAYLLARLGTGPLPDSLQFQVVVTKTKIEIRGRMRDLPAEAREPLGPLAEMVDTNTPIVAEILFERTKPEIIRFWLRRLKFDGFSFPELIFAPMMASVVSVKLSPNLS